MNGSVNNSKLTIHNYLVLNWIFAAVNVPFARLLHLKGLVARRAEKYAAGVQQFTKGEVNHQHQHQ
jgi:hypothetical protein